MPGAAIAALEHVTVPLGAGECPPCGVGLKFDGQGGSVAACALGAIGSAHGGYSVGRGSPPVTSVPGAATL